MAKKPAFIATVEKNKQFKDWTIIIRDFQNGQEVFTRSGYSNAANAWRGFDRMAARLFKPGAVAKKK